MTQIICLANSIRPGGRCIAGKDPNTGEWIRPVKDGTNRAIPENNFVKNIKLMDLSLLKERRIARKITQKQMGNKLGCSQMYISHLERGRKRNMDMIENLCTELDCELRIIPKT